MNKTLVKSLTFGVGLYFLLEFLLPDPVPEAIGGFRNPLSMAYGTVNNFFIVLGSMALLVGPINLMRGEFKTLMRKQRGWVESIVFFVVMVVTLLAAFAKSESPDAAGFPRAMRITYDALFYGINSAFYITSMGLVSFYLVSAAHRAFRLNSTESVVMMLSASIVMLGLTPAGDFVSQGLPAWLTMSTIGQWILSCPNTAVQKAALFGTCGGAFVAAMRQWLSIGKND